MVASLLDLFGRYRLIKSFMEKVLASVHLCLMQSDRDVQRIVELGASPDRVIRTGNMKFDQEVQDSTFVPFSRESFGLGEQEELIVAGKYPSSRRGRSLELLQPNSSRISKYGSVACPPSC